MTNIHNIDYWEKMLKNPPKSFIKLFDQEKEYLRNNIHPEENVLDIGCGDGRNILSIVDITKNIIGVDIDEKAIEDTLNNLIKNNINDIVVKQGDITDLDFDNNSFDVTIFSMTLVNLDDKKVKALSEMKRVTKDDGKIIISVYSEKSLKERSNMYNMVGVPIKSEIEGRFDFDIPGFMSESFSLNDIEYMCNEVGLKIENYEEVENLAYIITLKKI